MAEGVKDPASIVKVEESSHYHEVFNPLNADIVSGLTGGHCCLPLPQENSKTTPEVLPGNQAHEGKSAKDLIKEEMSPGKKKLYSRLNKQMKIEMTDGRVLVGIFLCTDRDANVILGSCTEFLNPEVCGFTDDPRMLGLVMVPGRHIVSIHHDASDYSHLLAQEEKELVVT